MKKKDRLTGQRLPESNFESDQNPKTIGLTSPSLPPTKFRMHAHLK